MLFLSLVLLFGCLPGSAAGDLLYKTLAQCTVDHLGHERTTHLFCHAVAQTPIYIRNLKPLDAIMGDVGNKVDVVYVELAFGLAIGIDLAEELYFVFVKLLAHLLDHPYVAEELGPEIAVAYNGFFDHAQMGVYQLYDLSCGLVFFAATSSSLSDRRSNSDSITA